MVIWATFRQAELIDFKIINQYWHAVGDRTTYYIHLQMLFLNVILRNDAAFTTHWRCRLEFSVTAGVYRSNGSSPHRSFTLQRIRKSKLCHQKWAFACARWMSLVMSISVRCHLGRKSFAQGSAITIRAMFDWTHWRNGLKCQHLRDGPVRRLDGAYDTTREERRGLAKWSLKPVRKQQFSIAGSEQALWCKSVVVNRPMQRIAVYR